MAEFLSIILIYVLYLVEKHEADIKSAYNVQVDLNHVIKWYIASWEPEGH